MGRVSPTNSYIHREWSCCQSPLLRVREDGEISPLISLSLYQPGSCRCLSSAKPYQKAESKEPLQMSGGPASRSQNRTKNQWGRRWWEGITSTPVCECWLLYSLWELGELLHLADLTLYNGLLWNIEKFNINIKWLGHNGYFIIICQRKTWINYNVLWHWEERIGLITLLARWRPWAKNQFPEELS